VKRGWRLLVQYGLLALVALAILGLGVPLASAYTPLPQGFYSSQLVTQSQQIQGLLDKGRYTQAKKQAMQAIAMVGYSPSTAGLYSQLGFAYAGLKQWPLAFASFQYAIRLDNAAPVYYENLVLAWQQAQCLPQAQAGLTQYLKTNPQEGSPWFLLGLTYWLAGNKPAAKTALQQHLALNTRSPFRGYSCTTIGVGCAP
jgi:tetratricopeptide (TPR) repeat protein